MRKSAAPETVSHYRILKRLGGGGMGEVYLAEDTRLDRKVAIKFLLPELVGDDKAKRRLLHEARAAAKLDHPNICAIHEVAEESGRSFIVMQHIEGETLASRLQHNPLGLRNALDLAVQLADAIAEAHSHGIIHRDIKPQNVMITERGQVKALDFGLAKLIPQQQIINSDADTASLITEPGLVVGTVPYMSPEQVRAEPLDARSDIFSFGAVLYEMISGRRAFAKEGAAGILSAILTEEPPALSRYVSDPPNELQRIVRRCLDKNRDRRYQTIRDVATDLENLCREREGQNVTTPVDDRTTRGEKAQTADSRSRLGRGLGFRVALVAITLTVLGIGAFIYSLLNKNTPGTSSAPIRSLAVLPLKSLDKEGADDYLGLGITDTIITKISQVGELTVRPTSAVRKYSSQELDSLEAAKKLKVDSVLDGTVQRAGDRLRVNVNLLRASDGVSLWSNSFNVSLTDTDIFEMQDRISQQVVGQLRIKLNQTEQARLAKRYTSSLEAYQYYVKGMYHLDRGRVSIAGTIPDEEEIRTAVAMFKRAIEIDRKYALAHAQIAFCYIVIALFVEEDNPVWLDLSSQSLKEAEKLDHDLAETHLVRAELYWSRHEGWKMEEAIRELRLAQQLNPAADRAELGVLYAHVGLEELSIRELERAMEIDPTSEVLPARFVEIYELFCKPDEVIKAQQRFHLRPNALTLLRKNRLDEAQQIIEQSLAENPKAMRARSMKSLLFALRGKYREAEAMIPAIVGKVAENYRAYHHLTYDIAGVYALQGKSREAVEWLRKTADTGMPNYILFVRDPHLDRIRSDPAFVDLMAELRSRWERLKREFE